MIYFLLMLLVLLLVGIYSRRDVITRSNRRAVREYVEDRSTNYIPYRLYKEYLKSLRWQGLRSKRLKLDEYTCQDCSKELTTTNAHVHHLTYKRLGDERMSDLVTLCRSCHELRHGRKFT